MARPKETGGLVGGLVGGLGYFPGAIAYVWHGALHAASAISRTD
jgi:predicted lipid-binding transport protein (Tim44 family)